MAVFGKKKTNGRKASTTSKAKTSRRRTTRTAAEKRAYEAGQAFAAGRAGKNVILKTEKERKSFSNGVKKANKEMRGV